MSNKWTCTYDGKANEYIEMLRLQNDKYDCGYINGYEHLVYQSRAYLVLAAVTKEMHSSDYGTDQYIGKGYYLIGIDT